MSRPSKQEAAIAHHEAGHAAVGFWEGVSTRLLNVSIVRSADGVSLGHVSRGKYPRVRDIELGDDGKPRHFYREFNPDFDAARLVERRLKPEVIECFAGVLAEKRFTGRYNWTGATIDMRIAGSFLAYLTGSERQAQKFSDYLWVVAEDAVAIHWPQIDELAQVLLIRKTMTGRETKAFLQAGTAAERLESERLARVVRATAERTNLPSPEPPEAGRRAMRAAPATG